MRSFLRVCCHNLSVGFSSASRVATDVLPANADWTKPCPDFHILVVGGVVLNQNRPLAAVSPSELFEEARYVVALKTVA